MGFANSINEWIYSHWFLLLVLLILGAAIYVFGPFPPIGGNATSSGDSPSPTGPSSVGPIGAIYAFNTQGDSGTTFLSLVIGIVGCTLLVLILWGIISSIMWSFTPSYIETLSWYIRNLIGLLLGGFIGLLLFVLGMFTITPGHKAYASILDYPFVRLGVGRGWILKGLMEVKIVSTAARQNNSPNFDKPIVDTVVDGHQQTTTTYSEEYLTKGGLEIYPKTGATFRVKDPLAYEYMEGDSVLPYVDNARQDGLREYIGSLPFDMADMFNDTTTMADRIKSIQSIFTMKGEISTRGPAWLVDYMNNRLDRYGLEVTQFQFKEVLFRDSLEEAAQRIFKELFESAGLTQNAVNQAAVAKTILEGMLTNILSGTDRTKKDLSLHEMQELTKTATALAAAAERQANYSRIDIGGTPPPGIIITPPPPTT